MQTRSASLRTVAALQSSKVRILDLPTEVLSEIFDLLTPHGKDLISRSHFPDLLAVRATCRTFRAICNTLRVWHDKNFNLAHMVCTAGIAHLFLDKVRHGLAPIEVGTRKLIEIFKEDKVLLETMARKEYWSFRTVPTMILFTETIPRFRKTIKELYYEGYEEWEEPQDIPAVTINNALAFNHLPNLTSLVIAQYDGKISLNQIVISCPSLKKLEFYSNTRYTGSLGGLRNLEKLIVWDFKLSKHTGLRAHLLPVDSAASLKNLQLFASGTRNNVYNSEHLLRFSKLEKFTVFPLCNCLCKTIRSANFRHLRKFNTVVYTASNISIKKVIRLFQSRSLASLEWLTILIEPYDEEFNLAYLELIRTITTHLPQVECLQLTTGINTAWCQLFSQMRKLESFSWVSADEECFVSRDMDLCPFDFVPMGISNEARDTLTGIVEAKMREVFSEFEEPPSVYIKLLDDESSQGWDEIFE